MTAPECPFVVPRHWEAANWYEAHKNETLDEMQRDAIESTLEFVISTRYFGDAPELRNEYIAGLDWCRRYLDVAKSAIPIRIKWTIDHRDPGLPDGDPILPFAASPDPTVTPEIERAIGKPPFGKLSLPPSLLSAPP
jgi:hypothetical protein